MERRTKHLIESVVLMVVTGAGVLAAGCAANPSTVVNTKDNRYLCKGHIREKYERVEKIEIHTISGECHVSVSDSPEVVVQVAYNVNPAGAMEPRMSLDESSGTLVLNEQWRKGAASGRVLWTLTIPSSLPVDFSSSSGGIQVKGLKAPLGVDTSSGRVVAENIGSDVNIRTASGSVIVKDVTGVLNIHSASGNINYSGCTGDLEVITAGGTITKGRN